MMTWGIVGMCYFLAWFFSAIVLIRSTDLGCGECGKKINTLHQVQCRFANPRDKEYDSYGSLVSVGVDKVKEEQLGPHLGSTSVVCVGALLWPIVMPVALVHRYSLSKDQREQLAKVRTKQIEKELGWE